MKESNNADISGRVQHPPLGAGGIIPTHNQQLPIKDKLSRLQLQSLFEKNAPVYSYQNNMAVPVVA
jgi:hypothetical protein